MLVTHVTVLVYECRLVVTLKISVYANEFTRKEWTEPKVHVPLCDAINFMGTINSIHRQNDMFIN